MSDNGNFPSSMTVSKKLMQIRGLLQPAVIIGLMGLSLFLAWDLLELENDKEVTDKEQKANQIMSAVDQELHGNEDVLMGASFLLATDKGATPDELLQFMTPYLMLRPEIDSVTWIYKVSDSERADFETKARKFFPGYSIKSVDEKWANTDHYFIYFQYPSSDLRGVDIATNSLLLDTIEKAKRENAVLASPVPLRQALAQLNSQTKASLTADLFYPVYLNGTKFTSVMNLSVNLDSLIANINSNFSAANMQMKIAKSSMASLGQGANEAHSWINNLQMGELYNSERSFKIGESVYVVTFSFTNDTAWIVRHKMVLLVLLTSTGLIVLLNIYWGNVGRLAKAKDRAEAASRSKSLFLANMSHEIRTPMNGVMGMIEQVMDTTLNKQQREWLEMAGSSAETLMIIINDILDLSKIEAGELKIESVPYELHKVIETVTDLLYLRASAKGIAMVVDVSLELPNFVIGDPLRLRQIVMNLVGNALKFTEAGHVAVNARLKTGNASMLYFEVEDTGIGIAESKISGVFKGFFQAEESTTRRFGGTGLGLSISRNLVEMMGGEIGVKSQPGKGSAFWFTLPLHVDTAKSEQKNTLPQELLAANILVVEHYMPKQLNIGSYIKSWGMKCSTVENVKSAFIAFSNSSITNLPYQFVIIDAESTGWISLLEYMALMPEVKSRKLRVLLYCPSSMVFDETSLKNKGVAAVLTKPFYPSHLLDMLVYIWQRKTDEIPELITRRTMLQVKESGNKSALPAVAKDMPGLDVSILLVDDQPTNRQLMQIILNKLKCRTDIASNGIEALEKAKENSYDIIFMDCHMPDMDGYEATKRIRKFEEAVGHIRRVPIIALTADAMQGAKELCIAAGMDDYMNKPVKTVMVREMIEKYGLFNKSEAA